MCPRFTFFKSNPTLNLWQALTFSIGSVEDDVTDSVTPCRATIAPISESIQHQFKNLVSIQQSHLPGVFVETEDGVFGWFTCTPFVTMVMSRDESKNIFDVLVG
jgi:hypothetical protein